jgi:hypothetical protein
MNKRLTKRRGISTVLTTVIILSASVVLAAGVGTFGASLFHENAQQEFVSALDIKLWVHTESDDGLAWGATKIYNAGDKVVALDTIKIRSFDVPYSQWYADTTLDKSTFQQSLNFTGWEGAGGNIKNSVGVCNGEDLQIGTSAGDICANVSTGPVILSPSQSAIIYFQLSNGTVTSQDSGALATVSIFAGESLALERVVVEGRNP